MLGTFRDEKMEAQFIATETKRLVAASGGMFEWKDFVILCMRLQILLHYVISLTVSF